MQTKFALVIIIVINTLGIMQMRLLKRLHVLHPITLLKAAKKKGLTFCPIDLTYLIADADQVPLALAEEGVAEQLNPPAEAVAQPAAEVHRVAEIQPAV